MKRFFVILAVVGLIMLAMGPIRAHAYTAYQAVNFAGPGAPGVGDYSMGWGFSPTDNMTVTALGTYDVDGLAVSHAVGIYNSAGTLLVSGTVPAAFPKGTKQDPIGWWAWTNMVYPQSQQGLHLYKDQTYYIMAATTGDGWTNQPSQIQFDDGHITYQSYGYTVGTPLAFPESIVPFDPDNVFYGYFGGNFKFTLDPVNPPVPIPGAIWLLGPGLIGIAGLRRRFSK
ncbi:MAG: VPLPA-CTERM sorting domain-containing protein [Proteobacteria bacterium]|nr:VPLPA-CTERM sorting domain-containing protein [Pseudomonadota bacterium]